VTDSTTISACDFLLDTNAVIGMGFDTLSRLAVAGIKLFSSPYTCWELLCHLEKPGAYHKYKRNLQKLKNTTVLNDPEHMIRQATRPSSTDQVGDDEIVRHCISCIDSAESLDAFNSLTFTDSLGQERRIAGVAVRAEETLTKLQTEFSALIDKIVGRLQELSVDPDDTGEHTRLIFSLLKGELSKYTDPENPDRGIWSIVRDRYMVFYGYTFYRALDYASSRGNIDPNDFEDASICKHVSLDHPFTIVTAEKRMRFALERLHTTLNTTSSLGISSKITVCKPGDLQTILQ
jgi:hypothetical protein